MIDSTEMPPAVRRLVLRCSLVFGFIALCHAPVSYGQTDAELVESAETHYYDFWPGKWVEVGNGDAQATTFTIRQGIHPAAFEEDWHLVYDGEVHPSTALRAWDQVSNRWMFTWVSENGLYQVWEGQKIGNDWYYLKEFEIDGETILSRQAWIPEGENRLIRILERSTDGGHSWTTRYRTTFERHHSAAFPSCDP